MRIEIENFYSLKRVSFEIDRGISVIAGKNGAGKSQLIAAICGSAPEGPRGLNEFGLPRHEGATITVDPPLKRPMWRPPVRKIAEESRGQDLMPLTNTRGHTTYPSGHVFGLNKRYETLHLQMLNVFVAGDLSSAKPRDKRVWSVIRESFERVFKKQLAGEFDRDGLGAKVGLMLGDGKISRFGQLSSGELEYVSLLSDILTEPEVDLFLIDEIEAHFHPDLQSRVLDEISGLCGDRTLLVSTQSPAVMLAADPEKLFFLKHSSEVESGDNQITQVATDPALFESLRDLYPGFSTDVRLMKHLEIAENLEILNYANQCCQESGVTNPEKGKASDLQISALRSMLLNAGKDATIVEYGVGKGRMLVALGPLGSELLSTMTYHAVDLDPKMEQEVRAYYQSANLQLKEFFFRSEPPEDVVPDVILFANVLHEVGPDKLGDFLCKAFQHAKADTRGLILECRELDVGERRFVVFDKEALRALFRSCMESGALEMNTAELESYRGRPLLEAVMTVREPNAVSITDEDVSRALQCVIDAGGRTIAEHMSGSNGLTARQLAFHSHNTANAVAYKRMLRQKTEVQNNPN